MAQKIRLRKIGNVLEALIPSKDDANYLAGLVRAEGYENVVVKQDPGMVNTPLHLLLVEKKADGAVSEVEDFLRSVPGYEFEAPGK